MIKEEEIKRQIGNLEGAIETKTWVLNHKDYQTGLLDSDLQRERLAEMKSRLNELKSLIEK